MDKRSVTFETTKKEKPRSSLNQLMNEMTRAVNSADNATAKAQEATEAEVTTTNRVGTNLSKLYSAATIVGAVKSKKYPTAFLATNTTYDVKGLDEIGLKDRGLLVDTEIVGDNTYICPFEVYDSKNEANILLYAGSQGEIIGKSDEQELIDTHVRMKFKNRDNKEIILNIDMQFIIRPAKEKDNPIFDKSHWKLSDYCRVKQNIEVSNIKEGEIGIILRKGKIQNTLIVIFPDKTIVGFSLNQIEKLHPGDMDLQKYGLWQGARCVLINDEYLLKDLQIKTIATVSSIQDRKLCVKFDNGEQCDFNPEKYKDVFEIKNNDDENIGKKVVLSSTTKEMRKGIWLGENNRKYANSKMVFVKFIGEQFPIKINKSELKIKEDNFPLILSPTPISDSVSSSNNEILKSYIELEITIKKLPTYKLGITYENDLSECKIKTIAEDSLLYEILKQGDIITKINDTNIDKTQLNIYNKKINDKKINDKKINDKNISIYEFAVITLNDIQSKKNINTVTIKYKRQIINLINTDNKNVNKTSDQHFGITLANSNFRLSSDQSYYGLIITSLDKKDLMYKNDFIEGDIIIKINDKYFNSHDYATNLFKDNNILNITYIEKDKLEPKTLRIEAITGTKTIPANVAITMTTKDYCNLEEKTECRITDQVSVDGDILTYFQKNDIITHVNNIEVKNGIHFRELLTTNIEKKSDKDITIEYKRNFRIFEKNDIPIDKSLTLGITDLHYDKNIKGLIIKNVIERNSFFGINGLKQNDIITKIKLYDNMYNTEVILEESQNTIDLAKKFRERVICDIEYIRNENFANQIMVVKGAEGADKKKETYIDSETGYETDKNNSDSIIDIYPDPGLENYKTNEERTEQIKKGDLLIAVNDDEIRDHNHGTELLRKAKGDIKVIVRRKEKKNTNENQSILYTVIINKKNVNDETGITLRSINDKTHHPFVEKAPPINTKNAIRTRVNGVIQSIGVFDPKLKEKINEVIDNLTSKIKKEPIEDENITNESLQLENSSSPPQTKKINDAYIGGKAPVFTALNTAKGVAKLIGLGAYKAGDEIYYRTIGYDADIKFNNEDMLNLYTNLSYIIIYFLLLFDNNDTKDTMLTQLKNHIERLMKSSNILEYLLKEKNNIKNICKAFKIIANDIINDKFIENVEQTTRTITDQTDEQQKLQNTESVEQLKTIFSKETFLENKSKSLIVYYLNIIKESKSNEKLLQLGSRSQGQASLELNNYLTDKFYKDVLNITNPDQINRINNYDIGEILNKIFNKSTNHYSKELNEIDKLINKIDITNYTIKEFKNSIGTIIKPEVLKGDSDRIEFNFPEIHFCNTEQETTNANASSNLNDNHMPAPTPSAPPPSQKLLNSFKDMLDVLKNDEAGQKQIFEEGEGEGEVEEGVVTGESESVEQYNGYIEKAKQRVRLLRLEIVKREKNIADIIMQNSGNISTNQSIDIQLQDRLSNLDIIYENLYKTMKVERDLYIKNTIKNATEIILTNLDKDNYNLESIFHEIIKIIEDLVINVMFQHFNTPSSMQNTENNLEKLIKIQIRGWSKMHHFSRSVNGIDRYKKVWKHIRTDTEIDKSDIDIEKISLVDIFKNFQPRSDTRNQRRSSTHIKEEREEYNTTEGSQQADIEIPPSTRKNRKKNRRQSTTMVLPPK